MGLALDFYNFIYIAVIVLGGVTLPLTLILQLKEKTDMSILFISHDAALGDKISDRRVEMI